MLKYGNAWISCFVGKQLQGVLDGASRHMMNCCKWYDFNFVVNMMVVVHVGRGRNRRRRKGLNDARAYVRKAEEGSKIFP